MRQLKNYSIGEDKKESNDISEPVIPSAEKYDGLTREQLLEALKRAVLSAKNNDSYSAEQIEDFCNFVTPMLDEEGKARLTEVMSIIDED
ncbi:MAG: hypothetical protein J1F39_06040 [Clostridiales bacterium]|nr:hypothetical protein [Clostridiales bacterium]